MKTFLSVILTISTLLGTVSLLMTTTVLSQDFTEKQIENTASIDTWTSNALDEMIKALPVHLTAAQKEQIHTLFKPVTDELKKSTVHAFYQSDSKQQQIEQISNSVSEKINEVIDSVNIPFSEYIKSKVPTYTKSVIHNYMYSNEMQQIQEASAWIHRLKTPVFICSIICGILFVISLVSLICMRAKSPIFILLILSMIFIIGGFAFGMLSPFNSYDFIKVYQKSISKLLMIYGGAELIISLLYFVIRKILLKSKAA